MKNQPKYPYNLQNDRNKPQSLKMTEIPLEPKNGRSNLKPKKCPK